MTVPVDMSVCRVRVLQAAQRANAIYGVALATVLRAEHAAAAQGVDAPRALALAAAGAAAGDPQARVLTHYGALRLAGDLRGLTGAAPGDEVLGAAALALLLAPGTVPAHVATLAEAGNLLAAAVARLDAVLDPPQPPTVPPQHQPARGAPPGGGMAGLWLLLALLSQS